MALVRLLPPVVRMSGSGSRSAWSALAIGVALACLAQAGWASNRSPRNGLPVIRPGLGVPDEPDAPSQGGGMKPLRHPSAASIGTPPHGRVIALSPIQTVRTLKARRFWR